MEKKRLQPGAATKTLSHSAKKGAAAVKTPATSKPGKTGATGIIKKTDVAERSVRTGKTGATGIIRETGKNGMEAPGGAANAASNGTSKTTGAKATPPKKVK